MRTMVDFPDPDSPTATLPEYRNAPSSFPEISSFRPPSIVPNGQQVCKRSLGLQLKRTLLEVVALGSVKQGQDYWLV